MNPLLFAAVALAGGLGAGLRHLVDVGVTSITGGRWPWGIFVVNVSGSFALGALSGALSSVDWLWILGVGLLGGYTTFSAVSATSVLLITEERPRSGIANILLTFIAAAGAAALGLWLGTVVLSTG